MERERKEGGLEAACLVIRVRVCLVLIWKERCMDISRWININRRLRLGRDKIEIRIELSLDLGYSCNR